MKTIHLLVLSAVAALVPGCVSHHRAAQYSYQPLHGGEVITSPTYATTTGVTPEYTVSGVPVYREPPTQGAAAATAQALNEADRELANLVRQELNSSSAIAPLAPGVQVAARSGMVTLSGTVPSEADRRLVDDIVRTSPGVVTVSDQMQVGPLATGRLDQPSRTYPPQPAAMPVTATGEMFSLHVESLTPEDRAMGERVLQGLRTDTILASIFPRVDIHVERGRVVLRGAVQSERQRRAIVAAVERAVGTGNVEDNLRINRFD